MTIDLRWIASFSTSCFHAAAATLDGHAPVDAGLAQALANDVDHLRREIHARGLDPAAFMEHVCALSAGIEFNRQLATEALVKVAGRNAANSSAIDSFNRIFSNLESAMRGAAPNLVDDLALRGGPLREQWDARGPGMMAEIARQTAARPPDADIPDSERPDTSFLVERADVILVHPSLGGAGAAHLPYNSVRIEAVLANPHDALPEIVRLGWLLSMLNLDLPRYSEGISSEYRGYLFQLATLPAALAAAEHVELVRFDPPTVELALVAWHIARDRSAQVAECLTAWWQECQSSRPSWPTALGALEAMMKSV